MSIKLDINRINFDHYNHYKKRYYSILKKPLVLLNNLVLVILFFIYTYLLLEIPDSYIALYVTSILSIIIASIFRFYLNHLKYKSYSKYWIEKINKVDDNLFLLKIYNRDELYIYRKFDIRDIQIILNKESIGNHAFVTLKIEGYKDIIQHPILEWENKIKELSAN